MATKQTKSKGAAKTAKTEIPNVPAPEPPRPGASAADLAGAPGPGPKVGDGAYQTPQEDHLTKGRPQTDSDGLNAGSVPPMSAKAAKLPGRFAKVHTAMPVCWVTDGRNPGKIRAAFVQRPTDPNLENADRYPIDLAAFPDSGKAPNNDHLPAVVHKEGVFYDETLQPNTWHFPEDSNDLLKKQAESNQTKLNLASEAQASKARSFGR